MKRATPCQMLKYKHALLLHKLYNFMEPITEWIPMNFNQIITGRQENFIIQKHNNYKIGSNILCNRLSTLNNEIPFSWLNMPISTYKVNCKKVSLMNNRLCFTLNQILLLCMFGVFVLFMFCFILFYFINIKTTVFIHVIFFKCTMYK